MRCDDRERGYCGGARKPAPGSPPSGAGARGGAIMRGTVAQMRQSIVMTACLPAGAGKLSNGWQVRAKLGLVEMQMAPRGARIAAARCADRGECAWRSGKTASAAKIRPSASRVGNGTEKGRSGKNSWRRRAIRLKPLRKIRTKKERNSLRSYNFPPNPRPLLSTRSLLSNRATERR